MNHHPRLSRSLQLTVSGLAAALNSATFPDSPDHKWVADEATGETIGWLRTWQDAEGSAVEWQHVSGFRRGYAPDEAGALAGLEAAVLESRRLQVRKPEPAHDGDHWGGRFL